MNDDEIVLLIAYVAENWPHYVMPTRREQLETRVLVWRDQLADLDAGLVRAVIADADGDHPPSPKQLRIAALRLAGAALPPDADAAAAEILSAAARVGRYEGPPAWSHPALGDTVDALGGWQEVCDSENPEALRAHLLKMYAIAAQRHRRRDAVAPAFAELVRNVDDEHVIGRPPAESVSALRSPGMEKRDDEAHLAQLALVHETLERARGEAAE